METTSNDTASNLPHYVNAELWAGFVESRRAAGDAFKPLAQRAIFKKLKTLHEAGWDANASLERAIMEGYRKVIEVRRRR